jgi:TolB-like protein/Tfp pilus assembly protein PilF
MPRCRIAARHARSCLSPGTVSDATGSQEAAETPDDTGVWRAYSWLRPSIRRGSRTHFVPEHEAFGARTLASDPWTGPLGRCEGMADESPERGVAAPQAEDVRSGAASAVPSPAAMGVWERLRKHKVAQWTLAYGAAAYTLLHIVEMLANGLDWPHLVVRIVILLLLLGLPVATTLAWFHGHRAQHRISGSELAILTVLLVLAGGVLWFLGTPSRDDARTGVAAQAPSTAVQAAPAKSIAVLPFVDMSENKDQEYFSDGLSEELIELLSRVPDLHVPARTSSFYFKGKPTTVAEIARALNVAHVLEGSVRKSGNAVRISAQLIRVDNGYHVWSQTFDRELSEIFKVQDEIASAVVEALKAKLLPTERERLGAALAVDPEAHDAYLKGLYHWYRLSREDLDTSERYFELALSRDPGYARAYAGLALLWLGRQQMGYVPPADAGQKIRAYALKAVELDDELAEAHYVLALAYMEVDWNWAAAEIEYRRAIDLNPRFPDAHAFYSHLLNFVHRPDEAMPEIRRALELDPFNELFHGLYGPDLIFVHKFDEAITELNGVLIEDPASPLALTGLLSALHHKREYRQALDVLKRYASAEGYAEVKDFLAHTAPDADYRTTMHKAADILAARSRKTFVLPWDVASWYAYAGDRDRCLEWLERSYQTREPNLPYLWYPDFDFLRSDPRFRDLMTRMKLPV